MPKSLSDYLGIDPKDFAETGAFDAILDVDSLLFIDPHLIASSSASEIAASYRKIRNRFLHILKMLCLSKSRGDIFWRKAVELFTFPELKGLCIGYSGRSTSGSGMGVALREQVLETAKVIVDAGTDDPEIFELMGVFEAGIGPDRISDMVGRIIIEDLLEYSSRIFHQLQVATECITYQGKTYNIVRNPYNGAPVILIPRDVLRSLPLAESWSDIDLVCAHNSELRRRVNKLIGETWRQATSEKKDTLKQVLLREPEVLQDLLNLDKQKPALRYDFESDPAGEVAWYKATKDLAKLFPLALALKPTASAADVLEVVIRICNKFKELIEDNGLWTLLYDTDGKAKHESAAQKLFYGVAESYCEANDLDLNREPNGGRGPVDFKFSKGYRVRVLVEVKLTTNGQLIHGLAVQIGEYQKAEKTNTCVYLVIDVGGPAKRLKDLNELLNAREKAGERVPCVILIDGTPKLPASKFVPTTRENR